MAYATTYDVEARWRPLSPEETEQAAALLDDAAALLDSWGAAGCDSLMCLASCEMVRHAMSAKADSFALAGLDVADTSFSTSEPVGDLWLSRSTQAALGIGVGRIGYAGLADE